MKQSRLMKLLAAGAACAVAASTAVAQTSATTTTTSAGGVSQSTTTSTSGAGVISAYTPGSDYISFRSETATTPVKYYYTKKTVLVDPEGRAVEWSALRPDMPV